MTYRCGIGMGMSRFGLVPGPPHVFCDACGVKKEALTVRGTVPRWLLDGKAPPGWLKIKRPNGTSVDYCPRCRLDSTPSGR